MTGAPVPPWADAVVKVEDTDAAGGPGPAPEVVTIFTAPTTGQNIRRAGEDLRAGAPVLEAGTVLGPRALSALASVGYGEVAVVRRPRVAVIATGAELVAPGEEIGSGQIPDSNSTLLAGMLRQSGADPVLVRTVADTAREFGDALPDDVDLVVTSGGISMGAYDPVKEYGRENGWTFQKVQMQPGKPQGHGMAGGVPVIALPGNPVAVAVSFQVYVLPFIRRLLGISGAQAEYASNANSGLAKGAPSASTGRPELGSSPRHFARAGSDWKCPAGRRQYIPAKLSYEGRCNPENPAPLGAEATAENAGRALPAAVVTPTHKLGSGSHLVASLHLADVIAIVPAEQAEVHAGDVLEYIHLGNG